MPLDLTALTGRQIGQQHSYWAVRHSHAIYMAARLSEHVARLRRNLNLEVSKARIRLKGEFKNKYEMDDAISLRPRVKAIADELFKLEAQAELIKALVQTYEGFRNAASREMSRRLGERESKD